MTLSIDWNHTQLNEIRSLGRWSGVEWIHKANQLFLIKQIFLLFFFFCPKLEWSDPCKGKANRLRSSKFINIIYVFHEFPFDSICCIIHVLSRDFPLCLLFLLKFIVLTLLEIGYWVAFDKRLLFATHIHPSNLLSW